MTRNILTLVPALMAVIAAAGAGRADADPVAGTQRICPASYGCAGSGSAGSCVPTIRNQSLQFGSPSDDEPSASFFPVRNTDGKWGIDPDSLQLGGALAADYPGQGAPLHARGAPSSLTIHALPYGNYDTAAALSIYNDAKRREASRDGIGAALERGDQAGPVGPLSSYPDTEAVNLYSLTHSSDARLILTGVTYDAHHIYPHPALTAAQSAQLRYGMNVTTNSLDPALPAAGPGTSPTLPLMNSYSAFVDGWSPDGSSIHVIGWTVTGGHAAQGGQVPGDRLDTHWTRYATRTALFGAPTKDFLNVWVMGYDPRRDRSGTPATSLAHRFEGLELDMYNEALSDYEASFHGMTINYAPHTVIDKGGIGEHPVRPAADSYDLLLGGDGIQKILRLTGSPTSTEIDGTTLHVDGNTGVPAWRGKNTGAETMESVTEAEGNRLRVVTWGQRSGPGQGWRTVAMNVGLIVDGTVGDPGAGSVMGRVTFNPPGHPGGIAIMTPGGSGLVVDDGGGVSLHPLSYRQLPKTAAAGVGFFCSDCLGPGERSGNGSGMNVFMGSRGVWKTSAGEAAKS